MADINDSAEPTTPSPDTQPTASTPSLEQTVNQAVNAADSGAAGSAAAQAEQFTSIRDAAREYGYDLSRFQDDEAALQHVIHQARQAQEAAELARYGQHYLQHADQFQQYLKTLEQAKPAPEDPLKALWNPPEFNRAWEKLITVDPVTKQPTVVPGAPPDLLQKVTAYYQYQKDWAEKFFANPIDTIKPVVEHLAKQQAESLVKENLGGYQAQVFADSFVQQNSNWLHQRDANGNVLYQQNGKAALSAEGQRFAQYCQQAQSYGIANEQQQANYALGMLQRDIALAQLEKSKGAAAPESNGTPAPSTRERTNNRIMQQHLRKANASQAGAATSGQTAERPSHRPSLTNRILQNIEAQGGAA